MFSWEQQSCNIRTSRKVVIGRRSSLDPWDFFQSNDFVRFLISLCTRRRTCLLQCDRALVRGNDSMFPDEGGWCVVIVALVDARGPILQKVSLPPLSNHPLSRQVRARCCCCCFFCCLRASPARFGSPLRAWDVLLFL